MIRQILILILFFCSSNIIASSYKAQLIREDKGVMWGFDFLSEYELFYSIKQGTLKYWNMKNGKDQNYPLPKNLAVRGQGGALDVKIHRAKNKSFLYLTFSEKFNGKEITSLARAEWKNNSLKNMTVIFRSKVIGQGGRHFGSRLAIVEDQLFMTIGDRGSRQYAQDLSYHNGKILRLTLEGKPYKDNPFIKQKNALPEIWSYGHRNPQGIYFDQSNKILYSCEFGPKGGDELNVIESGKNYGWPEITYGTEYHGPKIGKTHGKNMEQPLAYWIPSISPSGMAVYQGKRYKDWNQNIFLANLSSRHLRRLVLKGSKVIHQEKLFSELNERIRMVREGPKGFLYFSTDSGRLYRINKK